MHGSNTVVIPRVQSSRASESCLTLGAPRLDARKLQHSVALVHWAALADKNRDALLMCRRLLEQPMVLRRHTAPRAASCAHSRGASTSARGAAAVRNVAAEALTLRAFMQGSP